MRIFRKEKICGKESPLSVRKCLLHDLSLPVGYTDISSDASEFLGRLMSFDERVTIIGSIHNSLGGPCFGWLG